jgi:hypothetical protein
MSMRFTTLLHSRAGAVIGGAAVLVIVGGVGGAVAAGQIGSSDIRDGGVHRVDIHDHAVSSSKLSDGLLHRFQHHLEADGPYPGLTQLHQGANSTKLWAADSGATLQQSWVTCAPGKRAVGGGFGQWDYSPEVVQNMQIVTSAPATIRNGQVVDTPIPGDVDQSIRPNGWLVEGFNNNPTTDVSVRPWVVCAVMR